MRRSVARRCRRDERGSILIISVAFLVVMVLAAALAIDIGMQGVDKRDDHKVADLVALSAVQSLDDVNPCTDAVLRPHVLQTAQDAASHNGYSGNQLTVNIGKVDSSNQNFQTVADSCTANAVQVIVGSVVKYKFQPGSQSQHASAIAAMAASGGATQQNALEGGFRMGSFLGSLNSTQIGVLNQILGPMLGGSALNLTAVDYAGLANASMSLSQLQTQLLASGADVGTPDKLMGTNVTVAQLFNAGAAALTQNGDTAAASAMGKPVGTIPGLGSKSVSLGQIEAGIQQGDTAALAGRISAADLLVGAAEVANGTNFVSLNGLSLNISGVGSTNLSIKVIQAPVSYQGPVPGTLDTSQVQLTLTPTINTPVTVAGVSLANMTGQLPLTISGAGAHGVMNPGRCATSPGMDVTVTPKAYTESSSGTLSVTGPLGVNVASVAASVNTSITGNVINPPLTFNYPADFPPSDGTLGPSQRAGGTTVGLPNLNYTLNVSLLGLGTSVPAVQQGVTNALQPILTNLDNTISPVLRGLGIQVGGADVWALNLTCNGQIGQTQGTVTPQLVN